MTVKSAFDRLMPWYFPMAMLFWFGLLIGVDTHLILPLQGFIALYPFVIYPRIENKGIKSAVLFFILYSLFSLFLVLIGDGIIEGYVNDARIVILPMFAIFIGMQYEGDKVYKVFLISVVICMLVGLFLFIGRPSWYVSRVAEIWSEQWYIDGDVSEDGILSGSFSWASRFGSIYVTAYGVSYFATFAMCLLIVDFYKEQRHRIIKKRWQQIACLMILSLSIVLSQTRVALAYMLFLFIVGLLWGVRHHRPERRFFIYTILFIVLLAAFFLIKFSDEGVVTMFTDTIMNRFEDMQENGLHNTSRAYQITSTLRSWNNYLLGEGLGSRNYIARKYGLPGTTDSGYVKLLVEQGIVGFLLLFGIFIKSMIHAYKNRSFLLADLLIIGYVPLAMLGANPLGMEFDYMIIMWFALGHIWNKRFIRECVKENKHI